MKSTDLYRFETTDIEHVRKLVEETFHFTFEPHESYHYGDYYLFRSGGTEDETFMLTQNILFEDELHYPEFPENTVMLSVGNTVRGAGLRPAIENLGGKLLRSDQHD